MRLEKGDAAVDAFWAARKASVLEKAEALNEFADWPEDLKIQQTT
jgi:hypothetical protein